MTDPNTPTVGQPPVAEGDEVLTTLRRQAIEVVRFDLPTKAAVYMDSSILDPHSLRKRAEAIVDDLLKAGMFHRLAQSRPAPADAGMVLCPDCKGECGLAYMGRDDNGMW